MSEYGKEKGLQEILQELVTYCSSNTIEPINLKLRLPINVLDSFSEQYKPIEKIALSGTPNNIKFNISKLSLIGGTVELES